MNKKWSTSAVPAVFIAVLIFIIAGCSASLNDASRHLMRVRSGATVALMVLTPRSITVSRIYDTIEELSLESRDIAVDLSSLEIPIARLFKKKLSESHPNMSLVDCLKGSEFSEVLDQDPRKKTLPGYALIEPYRPHPAPAGEWTPEWEREQERKRALEPADDPRPNWWLLAADRPFGNGSQRFFYALDFKEVRKKTDAKYLLLVGIDSIHAVDRLVRMDITVKYRARLIQLGEGAMPVEASHIEEMDKEGAIRHEKQLLQKDARAVREKLMSASERYAQVLADQLGIATKGKQAEKR